MLAVDNVCMSFKDRKILENVNCTIPENSINVIMGKSGSGKSTLLHILGVLDRPDSGVIKFDGQNVSKLGGSQLNKFRNKKVGFVFQFYHLLDELSVLENVYLPVMAGASVIGWLGKSGCARKRATELLEQLGLGKRAEHKPYQLSGGERQRAAIARALMNEPELLLADEPTGNLDSVTGNGILEVFDRLNKGGQTIVMVTHDERIAKRAGRIITLADGKIA